MNIVKRVCRGSKTFVQDRMKYRNDLEEYIRKNTREREKRGCKFRKPVLF